MLLLGPALVRGELIYGFDTLGELYPWWTWAWREMAHGVWPHWNPFVMCGLPFHGLAVVSLAYPLSLANLALDPPRVITAWWLVHLALAGVWTQRFGRALGLSPGASALAGITFGASEALVSRIAAGELPQLAVVTWFPALLWALETGIRDDRPRTVLAGAVPIALMLLAGHLQYVAYGSLLAGGYAFTRLAGDRERRREPRLWLALAAAWLVGLALAAHQVLPTLDALAGSHRAWGLAAQLDSGILLTPRSLGRWIAPDLLGNEYRGGYVGDTVAGQVPLYVGVLPLFLAATALALRTRHAWRLGILAAAGVAFAFGSRLPLAPLLGWLLPPLTGFRIPSRMLVVAALPMAVLAGLGVDAVLERPTDDPRRRLVATLLAAIVVGMVTCLAAFASAGTLGDSLWQAWVPDAGSSRSPEVSAGARAAARVSAMWACLLVVASAAVGRWLCRALSDASKRAATVAALALTAFDLAIHARPWIRDISPEVARMAAVVEPLAASAASATEAGSGARVLARVSLGSQPIPASFLASYGVGNETGEIVPNWLAAHDVRTVTGEIGLIPARTMLFTGNAGRYRLADVEPVSRLDLLGVNRIVTDREPRALAVEERTSALPLAFLAAQVERVASPRDAERRLDESPGGSLDPRQLAIVESAAPLPAVEHPRELGSPGAARLLTLGTQDLSIAVDAVRPALLVVLDPYDPRWEATIDGSPAPLYPTQLMFRGVPVPAGRHRVRLRYVPRPFQVGVGITTVTTLLALADAVQRRRVRTRS